MAWLTGYGYRQTVPLKREDGAVEDYQMKLAVHKGAGDSLEDDVYLKTHALSWTGTVPNDIRFTTADGSTELHYWIESSDANDAVVWIEFDEIGTTDTDFYVYYGKADDTTTSNIGNTFILGDDFDRGDSGTVGNDWVETGDCQILSNALVLTRADADASCQHVITDPATSVMVEALMKTSVLADEMYNAMYFERVANYVYGLGFIKTAGKFGYLDSSAWSTFGACSDDTYYRFGMMYDISDHLVDHYIDNALQYSDKTPYNETNAALFIRFNASNANSIFTIDWIFERKYISPEPTWGTWGSEVTAPTVTTQAVSDIAPTTATGNGTITDNGGEDASAWGVCVATTENPDIEDTVFAGSGAGGVGAFTAPMTGLTPGEHYYVRAYATNSAGTGYGEQVEFRASYDRSSTALLGLTPSASRVAVLTRGDSALLGLLTTASRIKGITRAGTALLGLKVTASRVRGRIRSATALLGLKATATKTMALSRADTALLGLKTTATRVIALARTKTALLGLKTTASRVVALTRGATALLGLKTTASWNRTYIRSATALLGLKTTALRVVSLSRVDTALLGLKSTASRTVALVRSKTSLLGLHTTASRVVALTRTSTALLGLKTTALVFIPKKMFLTLQLYARDLTLKLHSRALITKLYNRALTLKARIK